MSRLPRPYIPIDIRVKVATYQALTSGFIFDTDFALLPDGKKLKCLLYHLFGDEDYHLDHDPALELRSKVFKNGVHVDYNPRANDPEFLIYRMKSAHHVKTFVRGDHGQYPDVILAARERNRQKKKTKRKYKWPKGRKLQSRPFQSKPPSRERTNRTE